MLDEIKDSLEPSDELYGEIGELQEKDIQTLLFKLSNVRHDEVVQLEGVLDILGSKISNVTCSVEGVAKPRRA